MEGARSGGSKELRELGGEGARSQWILSRLPSRDACL